MLSLSWPATRMSVNEDFTDFEEIEHTADWALRVRGHDLRELLVNAARGMSRLLVSDLTVISTDVQRRFELDAFDAESLLVEWLSELAYWAEAEMLVFREFDLRQVTPTHLEAVVRGGRAPNLQKQIKAVTYHNLEIIATDNGLEATVVFDV
jgi:SHS2 domain-containing protein